MPFFDRLRQIFGGRTSHSHADHAHEGGSGHGHGSVTCQEAVKLLYDYLDGELDGVSGEHVKQHLEMCRMCYPHLRFEESFRAAIHRAGEGGKAPEELRSHLLELLKNA